MLVQLHGHTHFSDGLDSPERVLEVANELGCSHVGITDHGTMAGTYVCFGENKVSCIPIAGIELYHIGPEPEDNQTYHITLLALNQEGYRNLCKLNYDAWRNKRRFPVSNPLNWGYIDGVACLTGCPQSYFAQSLMKGNHEKAYHWVDYLCNRFPVVCVEIMGGYPIYDSYCSDAMSVARKRRLLPVSTSDYHYCLSSDKSLHDALCVAKGRSPLSGTYSMDRKIETVAGKEGEENASSLVSGVQYEKWNLMKMHCNLSEKELVSLVLLKARELGNDYVERVLHEIRVIKELDMFWYISMLYSICSVMRDKGILYEARGSASGSLVCYLLGITSIDPIKHNLLFERFMSTSRREIPDIDIDVQASRRDELISCLSKEWNIAKMLTVNSLGYKAASRAVQRIKERSGEDIDVDKLVGKVYNTGVHASGIVLWPKDVTVPVPTRVVNGQDVIEVTMDNSPLVKWDLLGQKTLDVIGAVYSKVNGNCSVDTTAFYQWRNNIIENASLVSRSMLHVYNTSTAGVFQLEGAMTGMIARMPCFSLERLAQLVAIYRPAVLASGILNDILDNKPIDDVISSHCRLRYPVYQEDLMMILHKVVGFSLEDSYSIIKLAAKKDKSVLDDIERRIRERLSHFSKDRVDSIVSILNAYFGYGFNVAHAVAYAARMAITAYMRYQHEDLFFEELMNRENNRLNLIAYQMYNIYCRGYRPVPYPCAGIQLRADSRIMLVGLTHINHVSCKDAESIERIGLRNMHEFINMCLDSKVNRKTIQQLDECGVSRVWWGNGASALSTYDAMLYNRTRKKKRVTVPPDRILQNIWKQDIPFYDSIRYCQNAKLLMYPIRMPRQRAMCSGKESRFVGALFTSSGKSHFIDPCGEIYEFVCREHVPNGFVVPVYFTGTRKGMKVIVDRVHQMGTSFYNGR